MKTIIPNPENLERLKAQIKKTGYQSLHILSDLDRTLTYGTVDGVKTPSIISTIRDDNHLVAGYAKKAHALFDKYNLIEVDPNIPLAEKKRAMQEWWEIHNELLIESGLSKSDLEDIVKNDRVKFREGVPEFLDFLCENNIPLIVFSSSVCGDAIPLFFQKIERNYPNIFYITNKFNWDDNGKAISTKEPIIHCMNKDGVILEDIPEIREVIKDRRNIILLGDSIGDLGMIEGFDYSNLLTVGFLNLDYNESSKEAYEENFDVILEGDGDFNFVNTLIRDLG